MANQAALTLFAAGKTTGLVIESGDGVTYAVPISEGYPLIDNTLRINLAGRDLTNFLMKTLNERYPQLFSPESSSIVRDIKEKLTYIALDFEQEIKNTTSEKSYQLPSGQIITIGNERFRCNEALFRPSLIGMETNGISELVMNSISGIKAEIKNNFYENIILGGGNTVLNGFADRLQKEISQLVPLPIKVQVLNQQKREHSAWNGGSILASLPYFQKIWISKKEYEESGPSIVHIKRS